MFRGITGTGWVNVLEFWVRATPPYSSAARPIAASFSGQLWTRTWRTRVTAVPGRPPWTAPRRRPAGGAAGAGRAPAERAAPSAGGVEPLAHRGGQLRLVEVPDDAAPLDEA